MTSPSLTQPAPERGLPTSIGPSAPVPRPVLGREGKVWVVYLVVSFYQRRVRALWFLFAYDAEDTGSSGGLARRRGEPRTGITASCHAPPESGAPSGDHTVPCTDPTSERSSLLARPIRVGPSEHCIKTGARWAGQAWGRALWLHFYIPTYAPDHNHTAHTI